MSERKPIEVPKGEIITLVNVQGFYNKDQGAFLIAFQEIKTQDVDDLYTVGSAKIGKESFGKSFVASDNLLIPAVTCIDLAENREAAIDSVKRFIEERLYIDVNNLACHIDGILDAIADKSYKILDPETGEPVGDK